MEQLKKGDTFIRFSKYGRVFGVVDMIFPTNVMAEGCDYQKLVVRSTKGVDYDYSECCKVTKILNPEEAERRKNFIAGLKVLSERKSQGLIH